MNALESLLKGYISMQWPGKAGIQTKRPLVKSCFLILAILTIISCRSQGGKPEIDEYTAQSSIHEAIETVVKRGPFEESIGKLPSRVSFFTEKYKKGVLLERRLSFVGWDMNKDKEIDVLEVLGPDGEVKTRLYDFNFDGVIDQEEAPD